MVNIMGFHSLSIESYIARCASSVLCCSSGGLRIMLRHTYFTPYSHFGVLLKLVYLFIQSIFPNSERKNSAYPLE